jgi:hypothetical protein
MRTQETQPVAANDSRVLFLRFQRAPAALEEELLDDELFAARFEALIADGTGALVLAR